MGRKKATKEEQEPTDVWLCGACPEFVPPKLKNKCKQKYAVCRRHKQPCLPFTGGYLRCTHCRVADFSDPLEYVQADSATVARLIRKLDDMQGSLDYLHTQVELGTRCVRDALSTLDAADDYAKRRVVFTREE